MGNLQGSESKAPKSAKSPGKGNRLIKKRFSRGKKDKDEFTGIVPDDEDAIVEAPTVKQSSSKDQHSVLTRDQHDTGSTISQSQRKSGGDWPHTNAPPKQQVITEAQITQVTPEAAESSSDSVFTDPLTPVGFAAEINQCYYSEENLDLPDTTSTNVINSFKLNDFKVRKEEELTKKLNKLGVFKSSKISLDSNLDDCFVSEDVVIVNEMPKNATDGDCSLDTMNESGVESMDDTQDTMASTRRSSYYRPRKIELVATRITPADISLINSGKLFYANIVVK